MLSTDEHCDNLSIKQIVANDIIKYAEEMNIPLKSALKEIDNNTAVCIKTLERIVDDRVNIKPFVKTVSEIYSFLYRTDSLSEIITKAPPEISEYINKKHLNYSTPYKFSDFVANPKAQEELSRDSIFNQIYLRTSGDIGTDLETIKLNFGLNGLKKLDEMISLGYVIVDKDEKFIRGKKLSWTPVIIANFSKTLVSEILNSKEMDLRPDNYCNFFTWDTTQEDALTIKEIFRDAFRGAIGVATKSKPVKNNLVKVHFASTVASIDNNKGIE
jgi:type III secretion system FlhB-like substrate exporter